MTVCIACREQKSQEECSTILGDLREKTHLSEFMPEELRQPVNAKDFFSKFSHCLCNQCFGKVEENPEAPSPETILVLQNIKEYFVAVAPTYFNARASEYTKHVRDKSISRMSSSSGSTASGILSVVGTGLLFTPGAVATPILYGIAAGLGVGSMAVGMGTDIASIVMNFKEAVTTERLLNLKMLVYTQKAMARWRYFTLPLWRRLWASGKSLLNMSGHQWKLLRREGLDIFQSAMREFSTAFARVGQRVVEYATETLLPQTMARMLNLYKLVSGFVIAAHDLVDGIADLLKQHFCVTKRVLLAQGFKHAATALNAAAAVGNAIAPFVLQETENLGVEAATKVVENVAKGARQGMKLGKGAKALCAGGAALGVVQIGLGAAGIHRDVMSFKASDTNEVSQQLQSFADVAATGFDHISL